MNNDELKALADHLANLYHLNKVQVEEDIRTFFDEIETEKMVWKNHGRFEQDELDREQEDLTNSQM